MKTLRHGTYMLTIIQAAYSGKQVHGKMDFRSVVLKDYLNKKCGIIHLGFV